MNPKTNINFWKEENTLEKERKQTYIISEDTTVRKPAGRLSRKSDPIRFLPWRRHRFSDIPSINIRVPEDEKFHKAMTVVLMKVMMGFKNFCHYISKPIKRTNKYNFLLSKKNIKADIKNIYIFSYEELTCKSGDV